MDVSSPLTAVRALYLDIQGWAAAEPEQWARWVAPCPISSHEMRNNRTHQRRRTKERMDDRTRQLQPLLPILVRAVDEQREHLHRLLKAATPAGKDEVVIVDSRRYRRLFDGWRRPAPRCTGRQMSGSATRRPTASST